MLMLRLRKVNEKGLLLRLVNSLILLRVTLKSIWIRWKKRLKVLSLLTGLKQGWYITTGIILKLLVELWLTIIIKEY